MAPYVSNGSITTDKRVVDDTTTWSSQSDWEAYQSADGVEIVDGAVQLQQVTQPDSGLLRYLYEDDSDTSVAVDSWPNPQAYDGSISGATYTQTAQEGALALSFDGTDDVLDTSLSADTNNDHSIATWVWMRSSQDGSDECFIGGISNSKPMFVGIFSGGGEIGYQMRADDEAFYKAAESVSNVNNSQWYHIVGVYDPAVPEMRYYRDGSPIASVGTDGKTFSSSHNWHIGGRNDGTNYADIIADQTDVYSKALTDTEVNNLYNTGSING